MEMTGLQIFKYLPAAKKEAHSNCKECGCPTCMAFALKLAKQNIELNKCPYVKEELQEKYSHGIKHPQKTVQIGDLKIGGENVLYRHEKTFLNRTTIAIIVDCDKENYQAKIDKICKFEIKRVNEILKIDLIILKNSKNKNIKNIPIPTITQEELKSLPLDIIEDEDFHKTQDYLITKRTKAILEKDDKYSDPVAVVMGKNTDKFILCAKSSCYLCKYANMLIFEELDEAMFSTLLTLRQNIFTDPQQSLQVESGLYEFNNPNKNSIAFLTTNFALTFFAVANELEGLDTPSYLIVIPAEGMSVLTAWSAEKFSANIVKKTIEKLDIKNKINTRKIIIPGLLSHITGELKEACPDFDFITGTNEASAIADFVKKIIKE